MSRYRKYSTKFFCPRCRRDLNQMQMLYLDTEKNMLTCEKHPEYQKKCTCKMSDMIIFDMYPDQEKTNIKLVEEAPDFDENEAVAEVATVLSQVSSKLEKDN